MQATSRFERTPRGERVVERYVAVGDSFTAGVEEGQGSWADSVAEALRAVNPAVEYHNLAVAGAPSARVAEEQIDIALALRPDLVTVICGANDVLGSVRPDIGGYAARLSLMLERLGHEVPDAAVITATIPDLSLHMPLRPRTRQRVARGMRHLNEATRSVARRHGVVCLEFADHPQAGDRDNFAGDGFHPSPEGNRRAASALMRALAARFSIRTPALEPPRAS
jgi:lysophospholipase L1-like esterase